MTDTGKRLELMAGRYHRRLCTANKHTNTHQQEGGLVLHAYRVEAP